MTFAARAVPSTRPVEVCPGCGDRRARPFFTAPDGLHGVPGVFEYRRCGACGTVFQDPRVRDEDLDQLYPDAYYTHKRSPAAGEGEPPAVRAASGARDRIRETIRRAVAPATDDDPVGLVGRGLAGSRWLRERAFHDHVLDELLPWRTPAGRALDVGCGSGRLMAAMSRVGWRVEGAEVDERAAEVARHATGLPVHVGSAAALPTHLGPFDLVVMSHVIEHLPCPVELLGALSGLLAPGGRLVAIYPNPESLMARWFGRHWYHWDPPRHLVMPPLRALRRMAADAGLRVVRGRTLSRWAADTWLHSHSRYRVAVGRVGVPWHAGYGGAGLPWVERVLVAVGASVGEEVAAVLEMDGARRRGPGRGAP